MRVATSFPTDLAPERAHAYVADFATIAEWDPFIRSAQRLDPGPPRVGSRYRLMARGPLGRGFALDYVITDLEAPHRVRLDASSGTRFDGWDEISFAPAPGGGTVVRYAAEINLHGVGRLLYLVMPLVWLVGRIRRSGPLDGLQRRLDDLVATAQQ